jgi:hypothetical protein
MSLRVPISQGARRPVPASFSWWESGRWIVDHLVGRGDELTVPAAVDGARSRSARCPRPLRWTARRSPAASGEVRRIAEPDIGAPLRRVFRDCLRQHRAVQPPDVDSTQEERPVNGRVQDSANSKAELPKLSGRSARRFAPRRSVADGARSSFEAALVGWELPDLARTSLSPAGSLEIRFQPGNGAPEAPRTG